MSTTPQPFNNEPQLEPVVERGTLTARKTPYWVSWFQLLRFPAVFTALSDVFCGYLLSRTTTTVEFDFAILLSATACFYLAGMVLNDVFDVATDREERPERPLPSGAITVPTAALVGTLLLILGLGLCGLLLAFGAPVRTLIVGSLLTSAILLYDGLLKGTLLGPVAMGSCRTLNVLLAASTVVAWGKTVENPAILAAFGVGLYIVGVTCFALDEAEAKRHGPLVLGAAIVLLALGSLAGLTLACPGAAAYGTPLLMFAVIAGMKIAPVARAITRPTPRNIQSVVRMFLLSYIFINATLVFWHTGSTLWAFATIALLIPATQLRKLVRIT